MQLFEVNDGEKTHSCCCCWLYSKPCSLCKIIVHISIFLILLLAILLVILFSLVKIASDGFIIINPCSHSSNLPSYFVTNNKCSTYANEDFSAYFTNDYTNITFQSREDKVELKGWYFRNSSTAPVVVVTHGYNVCRNHFNTLLPAAILKKNGFNVISYDLRNHGQSEKTTGLCTWGIREHDDLLGAIDYARTVEGGRSDSQIALFGSSMGSRITSIGFGIEKGLAGAWIDSSVYSPKEAFTVGIENAGVTTSIVPAAWALSNTRTRVNLDGDPSTDYVYGNRKLFIAHSNDDNKAPIDQAEQYLELAKSQGAQVLNWFVTTLQGERPKDCTEHVILGAFDTKEYEKRIAEFFHSLF